MGKYLKKFQTTSQYNAYTADTANFIKPNVSLITETNTVEYNPYVPPETRVVAKFNVTSTSTSTKIVGAITGFSSIEIDGIEQPSVVSAYTFNTTGEHTVKYTLIDPATIGDNAFYGCSSLTSIAIPDSVTSIGGIDAFYGCTSVSDVYCYPNPANLTWNDDAKDDFKSDGSTICHVYSQYLSAYQTKFGNEVNVTFVGDLT